MAHEATSFSQAIGLASVWDVDLHERVFTVVAREMRARGAHYVLSPVLDVGWEQLQYLDESMRQTIEPGQFELMVGGSSDHAVSLTLTCEVSTRE